MNETHVRTFTTHCEKSSLILRANVLPSKNNLLSYVVLDKSQIDIPVNRFKSKARTTAGPVRPPTVQFTQQTSGKRSESILQQLLAKSVVVLLQGTDPFCQPKFHAFEDSERTFPHETNDQSVSFQRSRNIRRSFSQNKGSQLSLPRSPIDLRSAVQDSASAGGIVRDLKKNFQKDSI